MPKAMPSVDYAMYAMHPRWKPHAVLRASGHMWTIRCEGMPWIRERSRTQCLAQQGSMYAEGHTLCILCNVCHAPAQEATRSASSSRTCVDQTVQVDLDASIEIKYSMKRPRHIVARVL